jgi:membrane-associated phospholipid phosphatase
LTNALEKQGFERWGSGVYSLPLMGAFYIYGSLAKNERSKRVALLGVKAFVVSAALVTPVKQLIHRHRPNISEDPYQIDGPFTPGTDFSSLQGMWDGFSAGKHYTSLPSGHTMTAFVMATVISTEYKDKPWVPVIAYSVAGLTGLSRMEANKHWASDVLMGAAFGYAMGKLICHRNNWGLQVNPSFSSQAKGLQLTLPLR